MRRGYGRRVYRRTGRYYRSRNSTRRQFAAASSMRDIARFTLKYNSALTISINTGAGAGSAAINAATILTQTPQYTAFAGMFD